MELANLLDRIQTCPTCNCKQGIFNGTMDTFKDEERLFLFRCSNNDSCTSTWKIYFNIDESFEVTSALTGCNDYFNQFPEE